MKTLYKKISSMEKTTLIFLYAMLNLILLSSLWLSFLAVTVRRIGGIEGFLQLLWLRESVPYILLGFVLTACGGAFIDYVIKHENK